MDNPTPSIYRFAIFFALLLIGFLVVLFRIAYIQTIEREKWTTVIENNQPNEQTILPQRGNILDCEGRLLVSSIPEYYIWMDTRVASLHQNNDSLYHRYIDSICNGLSRIIGDKTAAEYKSLINSSFRHRNGKDKNGRPLEDGSIIRLCRSRISYVQKRDIQHLPLISRGVYASGVYFDLASQRKKPFGSLGSRTLGTLLPSTGKGVAGLEKAFDDELHGEDGLAQRIRVGGRWEEIPIREAVNGCDVVTTLDVNLLDITESALRSSLERLSADWGCCILMETHSGKIRAICNLDRTEDGHYFEIANHAVMRVEPGSTFKTISLMAALDDGKVQLTDTFDVYKNGWMYHDARHTDAHPKDTVYDLKSALAISSNIAFAKMILKSYDGKAAKFVDKLQRMGLKDSIYCEIPGAQSARIEVPNDGVTLSKMSYGYSVELTPMQIITFYNGIANNGKMIRPYMVEAIRQGDRTLQHFDTETLKSSMCRTSTLEEVQSALHEVVWNNDLGTASVTPWGRPKAQSKIVPIAGKTGTAQLLRNGRYTKDHRMTFVGYFPEENPEYTCICMIENPRIAHDAGMDCGSVVRQIAERTIVYSGNYIIDGDSLVYKLTTDNR